MPAQRNLFWHEHGHLPRWHQCNVSNMVRAQVTSSQFIFSQTKNRSVLDDLVATQLTALSTPNPANSADPATRLSL